MLNLTVIFATKCVLIMICIRHLCHVTNVFDLFRRIVWGFDFYANEEELGNVLCEANV